VPGADEEDPHLRESLGLYLLGALSGEEREAVERHLAGCLPCCVEANELGAAVDALALLPQRDVHELIAECGIDESDAAVPARVGPVVSRGARTGRTARLRRAALRRSVGEPHAPVKRWAGSRRRAWTIGACVLAVVLTAGVALGFALASGSDGGRQPAGITLAATATAADRASGATLSVFVTGDERHTDIRAVVSGLQDGQSYQLFVVTSRGRTIVVSQWPGSNRVREITGWVQAPADTLVFFTVATLGGSPVVSAYLSGVHAS
jgi:anti-sigma factor RsiW